MQILKERVKNTEINLKCMYLYNLKLKKYFVFFLPVRTIQGTFLFSILYLMWMTYETSEALMCNTY